jgi:hypothetical protein
VVGDRVGGAVVGVLVGDDEGKGKALGDGEGILVGDKVGKFEGEAVGVLAGG